MKVIISTIIFLQVSLISGQISITVKNSCSANVCVNDFNMNDNTANALFAKTCLDSGDETSAPTPAGFVGYIFGYNTTDFPLNPVGVTRVQFTGENPTIYYVIASGMNYNLTVTPSNAVFGCGATSVAAGPNDGYAGQTCTTYSSNGSPVSVGDNGLATQICFPNPIAAYSGDTISVNATSYTIDFCGSLPQPSSCAPAEYTTPEIFGTGSSSSTNLPN